ncbi:hypothetical protein ACE939_00835 [Aquimarina sp. W85]|uniref:hypothetical protein n=1 Tax=Aquimarina rhodophyticola TaxID=3342246 RepID=UPI003670D6B4
MKKLLSNFWFWLAWLLIINIFLSLINKDEAVAYLNSLVKSDTKQLEIVEEKYESLIKEQIQAVNELKALERKYDSVVLLQDTENKKLHNIIQLQHEKINAYHAGNFNERFLLFSGLVLKKDNTSK